MINVTYEKTTISPKNDGLDNTVFTNRIAEVVRYYRKILSGTSYLYSTLLVPNQYPRPNKFMAQTCVHIIPTLLQHDELRQIGTKDLISIIQRRGIKLPEGTTHILVLDIFGKIFKILKTKAATNSFLEAYGDKFIGLMGDIKNDIFGVHKVGSLD